MCFSATASFSASIGLTLLGALSIKKAKTRSMRLFASTPLLFAVQQAAEGVVWLTATHTSSCLLVSSTYAFLFFAFIFWPLWMPLVARTLEQNPQRKSLMNISVLAGCSVAAYSLWYIIYNSISAQIQHNHIAYISSGPTFAYYPMTVLYLLATVAPLFLSSVKHMWILGIGISVSYIVTVLQYTHNITSVWCFFAALLSGCVLYIVHVNNNK